MTEAATTGLECWFAISCQESDEDLLLNGQDVGHCVV